MHQAMHVFKPNLHACSCMVKKPVVGGRGSGRGNGRGRGRALCIQSKLTLALSTSIVNQNRPGATKMVG